jgi:hypothetical protein
MVVFWDVALCSLVDTDGCSRGACCLHHQVGLSQRKLVIIHKVFSRKYVLKISPLSPKHLGLLILPFCTLPKCSSILHSQLSTMHTRIKILNYCMESVTLFTFFHILYGKLSKCWTSSQRRATLLT